jgi:ribonuclease R
VAPFGLFVELIEHYVEGLVHVSSMADDYYRFHEQQHVMRGENTRKVYRLGDKVHVQVVRVDMERRQVDLGIVEILENVRREERHEPIRSRVKPKRDYAAGRTGSGRTAGAGRPGAGTRRSDVGAGFSRPAASTSRPEGAGRHKKKQRPGRRERAMKKRGR